MSMLCDEDREQYFNFLNERFNCIHLSDCYDREYHPNGWNNSVIPYWDEEDYWEAMAEDVGAYDVRFGASKVVFWFHEIPEFVVKIPIIGRFDQYCEDFVDYECARMRGIESHHGRNDYCGLEADISITIETKYQAIKSFFALTEYIGTTTNGINLYLSDRVDFSLGDSPSNIINISSISETKAEEAESTYGYYVGDLCPESMQILFEQNKEELVYQLFDFIHKHNIQDLHSENLGFTCDNQLVLMDFSGFSS